MTPLSGFSDESLGAVDTSAAVVVTTVRVLSSSSQREAVVADFADVQSDVRFRVVLVAMTRTAMMVVVGAIMAMPAWILITTVVAIVMSTVKAALTFGDLLANTQVVFNDTLTDEIEEMLAVQADSESTYYAEDTTFDGFKGEVG